MSNKKRALEEAARLTKKYGNKTGDVGSTDHPLNVTPTGSWSLDYATGIGGWPRGHPVMVFGPRDIGKSSVIGFQAIQQAQRMGLLCGIIAVEPGFDKNWAYKHGVDPDTVVIARPDTAEDAFNIMHDWCQDDIIDFMVFDSIGAVTSERERKEDAKSQMGGNAKLITEGTKKILMPTWKNNKSVILLNQVRDNMAAQVAGAVKMPGGHGQEHTSAMIVQLKPGKDRYTIKEDGVDVEIGRTIKAVFLRNKLAEGSRVTAEFDFYQKEVEGFPFGLDIPKDIINIALKTGVFEKNGNWYVHPSFPETKSGARQVNGKAGVTEAVADDPKILDEIRKDVLGAMQQDQVKKRAEREAKETVNA
jgi:recombination protein RecA